jgi:GntR family transcriptional regulator
MTWIAGGFLLASRVERLAVIDSTIPVPKYHQLKQILREKIDSGEWMPGELLPSENELCAQYKVSRTTVRQTMAALVAEGLVTREQGRGTFVARPKLVQGLMGFYSFTEEISKMGLRPRSDVLKLGTCPAGKTVAKRLAVAEGEEVVFLTRLRLASEEPIMFETSYLPHRLCPGLAEKDLSSRPLYTVLREDYGFELSRAREEFQPALADDYEARWLRIDPGSPVLLLERVAFMAVEGEGDRPLEFCRSVVRGDRCRFYVELPRRA